MRPSSNYLSHEALLAVMWRIDISYTRIYDLCEDLKKYTPFPFIQRGKKYKRADMVVWAIDSFVFCFPKWNYFRYWWYSEVLTVGRDLLFFLGVLHTSWWEFVFSLYLRIGNKGLFCYTGTLYFRILSTSVRNKRHSIKIAYCLLWTRRGCHGSRFIYATFARSI